MINADPWTFFKKICLWDILAYNFYSIKQCHFYHHEPILLFIYEVGCEFSYFPTHFLWELLNHFLAILDLKADTQHEKILKYHGELPFMIISSQVLNTIKHNTISTLTMAVKNKSSGLQCSILEIREVPDNQSNSVFNSKP